MKKKVKDQNGTAIVEFAFVIPLLFLLVFGIIEFGFIMYNKAMITNASREGARFGTVYRLSAPGTYSPPTRDEILKRTNDYLKPPLDDGSEGRNLLISFPPNTAEPELDPPEGCISGEPLLRVTVSYGYHFLVLPEWTLSFGKKIIIDPLQLQAETVMRCE